MNSKSQWYITAIMTGVFKDTDGKLVHIKIMQPAPEGFTGFPVPPPSPVVFPRRPIVAYGPIEFNIGSVIQNPNMNIYPKNPHCWLGKETEPIYKVWINSAPVDNPIKPGPTQHDLIRKRIGQEIAIEALKRVNDHLYDIIKRCHYFIDTDTSGRESKASLLEDIDVVLHPERHPIGKLSL